MPRHGTGTNSKSLHITRAGPRAVHTSTTIHHRPPTSHNTVHHVHHSPGHHSVHHHNTHTTHTVHHTHGNSMKNLAVGLAAGATVNALMSNNTTHYGQPTHNFIYDPQPHFQNLSNCNVCSVQFGTFSNHRHHCRNCGHSYCNDHSNKLLSIYRFSPPYQAERVCDSCYRYLTIPGNNRTRTYGEPPCPLPPYGPNTPNYQSVQQNSSNQQQQHQQPSTINITVNGNPNGQVPSNNVQQYQTPYGQAPNNNTQQQGSYNGNPPPQANNPPPVAPQQGGNYNNPNMQAPPTQYQTPYGQAPNNNTQQQGSYNGNPPNPPAVAPQQGGNYNPPAAPYNANNGQFQNNNNQPQQQGKPENQVTFYGQTNTVQQPPNNAYGMPQQQNLNPPPQTFPGYPGGRYPGGN